MRFPLALLAFCLPFFTIGPADAQAEACGPEAPCAIAEGTYHLRLPGGWDGQTPLPAVMFFHGHRGSGRSIFRPGGLETGFLDHGYAVIAPNGALLEGTDVGAWPGRDTGGAWRDDIAFSLAVLDDVAARLPLDQNRIYAAGFSAGGSMVWQLACFASERFGGFASVAGALRAPNPPGETCATGPVRLLQVHGFADAQVPYEGRAIRDWHQGDLFEGLARLRATNQCRSNPDAIEIGDAFRCRGWSESCGAGAIQMCEHDGGHGLPRGWTDLAREWFEASGRTAALNRP